MTWAMIADIDIESEKIRFLGNLRMDVWGAWRVLNLRSYKAKFSYLPVDEDSEKKMTQYQCPELGADVPSNWITIEDDFILFMASQVSHSSYNIQQSPNSKLQDGVFRVWIIR
jgi:sphingosine kinase